MTEQQIAAMRQALEYIRANADSPDEWDMVKDLTAALADHALDKKAENAREIGLDYEPAQQEPVAWMHNHIEGNVIAHRPADLDRHPDRWTALYEEPKTCPTCESLARTVMLDQTSHDTRPQAPEPVIDKSAAIRIATALGWEPKREPLTNEKIESLWDHRMYVHCSGMTALRAITRAIEAAHGITGEKK